VRIVCRLGVGVALAALATTGTVVASPGSNGVIAYGGDGATTAPFGAIRLFARDPVGATVRLGSLSSPGWIAPSWSPDGTQLAVDTSRGVLLLRADGRIRRKLFPGPRGIAKPAWAPDGSRIAITARGDIWVLRVDGSFRRRLTRTAARDTEPAWSPDGREIAFVSDRAGTKDVWLMDVNGGRLRNLTAGAGPAADESPAWSPDGRRIAFVSGRTEGRFNSELWLMDANGSSQHRVQPAASPDGSSSWEDRQPAWSPDGNWLAYSSSGGDSQGVDLFIVRPDGRDRINLTAATPAQHVFPDWQARCDRAGTARADVLLGDSADELLCGGGGADRITGDGGSDRILGGEGNDRLLARDGSFDVVGCGPGRDEVVADGQDLVGVDCERVRASGGGGDLVRLAHKVAVPVVLMPPRRPTRARLR
jgi:Tol biopolymer transport system component